MSHFRYLIIASLINVRKVGGVVQNASYKKFIITIINQLPI